MEDQLLPLLRIEPFCLCCVATMTDIFSSSTPIIGIKDRFLVGVQINFARRH